MSITKKDKRTVIEPVAEDATRQFFTEHNRLRRWLQCGFDVCKINDHARMPIIKMVKATVPETHFDVYDTHDTNTVERVIVKAAVRYEGLLEPREHILQYTPPHLEGDWAPFISRRDELKITPERLEALQYLTEVELCVDTDLYGIFRDYRDTLTGYDPITGASEQEKFMPRRAIDEFDRVGSRTHHGVCNILDSRARIYYNTLGTMHPMFCKKARGFVTHSHFWPVSTDELTTWAADLKADTGLDDYGMEQMFHGKNPQTYLKNGGNGELLSEVWHYLGAKRTGRTRSFSYIDAHASGITLKELSTGWPKAVQNADSRLPGWTHPYRRYTNTLWTDMDFRRAIRGNPEGVPIDQFLELLRKDIKPAPLCGGYNAGGRTMCLSVLGNPTDTDTPFDTFEDVELALPSSFSRWLPKSAETWVDDFVDDFKRPVSIAMRRTFPADMKLNAHLNMAWKTALGKDGRGQPPVIRMPDGFKHDATPIRRNRDQHRGLHYMCPFSNTKTTVQHKLLEVNHGLELSPNGTHAMDAMIMTIFILLCKQEGIPVIAIHDAAGVPRPFLRRANQLYVEATNWVISHNIWGQFGFKPFGMIPVLDPDTGLLGR